MKPAKQQQNTRHQPWGSLSSNQQDNIRQMQAREALAAHTLVRLGTFWGCTCGCAYVSTAGQPQRIAESAHAVHIAAYKERRESLACGNEIEYA